MMREWMRGNNIPFTTNKAAIQNPAVMTMYEDLVNSFNKYFNHVEQVKKIQLLSEEWNIDSGEMTPKMSVKRKVVMERHAEEIEKIYG